MTAEQRVSLVSFGRAIRALRVKAGFSQEKLAEYANLHRTYIGMIERGEKNITLSNILKLGEALGVPASQFFLELENGESNPSWHQGQPDQPQH